MKKEILHHNSGFKIPKDYLESFEDKLNTELFLTNLKAKSFKTPENYLENFEVNTIKTDVKETKVISLLHRKTLLTITSIAATIALLLTLTLNKTTTNTLDSLENDTLKDYVLNETSSQDFAYFIEDTDINASDFLTINSDDLDAIINEIDLEDFLEN